MNILDADFTLYQIEQTLEERFRAEEKTVRTIGDLNLTYEDYKYLILKLKGISKYISRVEVFEQYKLSIITAIVFSIRYEHDTAVIYQKMTDSLARLQQHQLRFFIRIATDAFYELGLSTYGIRMNTIDDVLEVATLHANLSKEEQITIFQMIEAYYEDGEDILIEEDLYERMNAVVHKAFPVSIHKTGSLSFCYLLKDLYEACSFKHNTLNQLFVRYNQLSKELIEACWNWQKRYSNNKNLLEQVR